MNIGKIQFLNLLAIFIFLVSLSGCVSENPNSMSSSNSSLSEPVKLIFIHHSCGENWLADENGGLGKALKNNKYFVSDTNYGWGPDGIGDQTDIGQLWLWFRGPESDKYLNALYSESGQNSAYSRLSMDPGGENEIIMFKSCFPNSALQGKINDPVPPISENPLRGQDSSSQYHTVANAKGIYIDLLNYFKSRPDKLFIVITAPPLSDPTYGSNARAFNNWLKNDWLKNYTQNNVYVFDFYNILANENNVPAYPSGDDHPNQEGNQLATKEFIPFINQAYQTWKSGK